MTLLPTVERKGVPHFLTAPGKSPYNYHGEVPEHANKNSWPAEHLLK